MDPLEALLYGAVQGVTEYLPISSSAHLILLPRLLGREDPGLAFDVFLHVGTLLATLVYFRRDWMSILRGLLGGTPEVPVSALVVATVPALVAGALLHKLVATAFRGNAVMVVTLTLGGVALWAADRFFGRERPLASLTRRDAWWIGIAQCCALVPGISRSGATITAGRVLGFDRAAAARFSFLISAPITGAATVFELRHYAELAQGPVGIGSLVVAGISSFVFGFLAIGGLLRMLRRFGYLSFAVYRVVLAGVILAVLGT
jgi:undecaprenyl-diphosphatase